MPLLRRRYSLRSLTFLAVAAPAVLASRSAAAQSVAGNFALDRYEPTAIGDRFFSVPGGAVDGDLQLRAGLIVDYAKDPLVLHDTCEASSSGLTCNVDGGGSDIGSVVSSQLYGHLGVSFAIADRVLVSASLPIAIVNSGDETSNPRTGSIVTPPDGAALGDLRLGARVQLLGERKGPAELALGADFWLPTGDPEGYTGDPTTRAMPYLALSGQMGMMVYAANLGVMVRETGDFVNVRHGTELRYGVAAGVLLMNDMLQVGPELYGATTADEGVDPFKGRTTNIELLLGGKLRAGDFVVGAAAGPGLTHGVGTPALRVLGMISYSPDAKDSDGDGINDPTDACPTQKGVANDDPKKNGCPADKDGDGFADAQDACPEKPGIADPDPKKNGCPPPGDRDGDTIVDSSDQCPDTPGVADADPARNGCPPDRDGDKIIDPNDACPEVAGVESEDPKKNGCPADKDGDGILDAKDACPEIPGQADADPAKNGCPGDKDGDSIRDDHDACPNEKGSADPDPKQNGCPKLVRVTGSQIVIMQQVQFQTGSDKILPASDALLGEVQGVLKDHAEIKKVRVEGHTDDKGAAALNKTLSEKRAASVMKWLVDHGVDAGRLESKGFGKDKPIADNATEEGRQKNRRVEFHIVDPAPPPGSEPAPLPAPQTPPASGKPAGGKPAGDGLI